MGALRCSGAYQKNIILESHYFAEYIFLPSSLSLVGRSEALILCFPSRVCDQIRSPAPQQRAGANMDTVGNFHPDPRLGNWIPDVLLLRPPHQ